MRRHRPLIGWPMRNSKRLRFSMPNEIWDQKLRPIEFTIFSYLCYYQSHDPPDQIALQMIANGVHSTVSTVNKYIASLISKGLITSKWSPAASLQCNSCKNFFTLPNEIFLLKLPPSANTALKSINVLLEVGLITVKPSSYFDRHGMKWKGNNLYTILPIHLAVDTFHQRQLRKLELDMARFSLAAQTAM